MRINTEHTDVFPLRRLWRTGGTGCLNSVNLPKDALISPPLQSTSTFFVFFVFFPFTRSYVDISQMEPHVGHQMSGRLEPDDSIYWHEGSKPGTIV